MPKIYVPNETKNCYATYFLNGLIYAAIIKFQLQVTIKKW